MEEKKTLTSPKNLMQLGLGSPSEYKDLVKKLQEYQKQQEDFLQSSIKKQTLSPKAPPDSSLLKQLGILSKGSTRVFSMKTNRGWK